MKNVKIPLIPSYIPYNSCYNNTINGSDSNDMFGMYNWNTDNYENNGKIVSWSYVQQQITEKV